MSTRPRTDLDDELHELWAQYREALNFADAEAARRLLAQLTERLGEDDPDIRYEHAAERWNAEGPAAALGPLDALLRDHPEHADAHHARALACGELGDQPGMIAHFLEVLKLDAAEDQAAPVDASEREEALAFITATAEEVLGELPERFLRELDNVPVVLEERPHEDIVRAGFDPRALGLFEGLEHGQQTTEFQLTAPTRIVLFTANLLADFPEPELLAEEIEITLLHEIGHFFGLDEDGVEALGLA